MKRGEQLRIGFYAKSSNAFKIPSVTGLSFNGAQICPDREPMDVDTSCAKLEMTGNVTGGRWDGVLTVYPKFRNNGIRVDIELDEPAWALGVSLML